jgi:DNA-directed RNA polymerase subunit RPC12/RpoP
MGQRRTCPNCQSIFVAGKSVAESTARVNGTGGQRRGLLERAAEEQAASVATLGAAKPPIDKTMLGEVAAAICYNCPRCKKPLESPASEAGTKKPCPSCGGRLQVPAASPAPAPAPDSHLNKTLLAESSVPQITPSRPSSSPTPAVAASAAAPQAAPMAALAGWRKWAIAGGVAAVLLLGFLYYAEKQNAIYAQYEAQNAKYLEAQKELIQLKADIEKNTALLKQKQESDAATQKLKEELEARRLALEKERDAERQRIASLNDDKAAAEARAKAKQKDEELERLDKERQQRLKAEQETQAQLAALKLQLETANHRQTIIQQAPPPVVVHPPWYYHHPYWW